MIIALLFLIGVSLAIGPWLVVGQIGWMSAAVCSGFGLALILIVAITTIVTRLYRRASANLAFVRTGSGGAIVVKDSGKLVVPVLHQVIPVSLETMRLNVERRGTHALI